MSSDKADWANVILAALTTLGVSLGAFVHFTSELAVVESRVTTVEKAHKVLRLDINDMDQGVTALWVDTTMNTDNVRSNTRDIGRVDKYFEKFADAVDRLSISVARLEEQIKHKGGVK